MSHKTIFE